MIPRIPSSDEMARARVVVRMVTDGWSYVHIDDLKEAEDILRRRLWWLNAVGIAGAVVVALGLFLVAVAVWS